MLTELSNALQNAQNKCIGLFKTRGIEYLVIEEHKPAGTLTCIKIGNLFGLQTLHIVKTEGHYAKFPKKKTLFQFNINIYRNLFIV